jgi:hypothetical protein
MTNGGRLLTVTFHDAERGEEPILMRPVKAAPEVCAAKPGLKIRATFLVDGAAALAGNIGYVDAGCHIGG